MTDYDTIPVKPGTKEKIDEQKPDGVTYDYWVRDMMGDDNDA